MVLGVTEVLAGLTCTEAMLACGGGAAAAVGGLGADTRLICVGVADRELLDGGVGVARFMVEATSPAGTVTVAEPALWTVAGVTCRNWVLPEAEPLDACWTWIDGLGSTWRT